MNPPKDRQWYIQLFSIHGLIRHQDMELGRDADTGGQVRYVVELARALSRSPQVGQVDLVTRLIVDKRVSEDYGREIEPINDKCRIVRIRCGGRKYMRKERLWPHLDEFVDKTIGFLKKQDRFPDLIHGHYADAGWVAIQLSDYFGVPLVFTGHSLGRPKKQKLLNDGMTEAEIEQAYKIGHRISVEEEVLKNADLIITSTRQEVEEQYGLYENKDLAAYAVIPPGIDLDRYYPFYRDRLPETRRGEEALQAYNSVVEELERFFMMPDRPLLLAICRPDKRKNISGLIEAYGRDKELQAMANLAVFAGIRKNIMEMEENEKEVLTHMLLLMDKYDLYGKMAIPKTHDPTYEVPELYRIAAASGGVFVNVAWTEPFGITLIEAAAAGLPIVATNDGGPRDIVENLENGLLVDPSDHGEISRALRSIVADPRKWKKLSRNGSMRVGKHYSWEAHVEATLEKIRPFAGQKGEPLFKKSTALSLGERLTGLSRFVFSDLDGTLTEAKEAVDDLKTWIKQNRWDVGMGVATGRGRESALELITGLGFSAPDVLVCDTGTRIFYRDNPQPDLGWQTHISKNWERKRVVDSLRGLGFLEYRAAAHQAPHKVSYRIRPGKDREAAVHDALSKSRCRCNTLVTGDGVLDVLPVRASKGKALRYLSYKWGFPFRNILVCGNSAPDREMLTGSTMGVVVKNYEPALEDLRKKPRVYFSEKPGLAGLLDGLNHYGF